MEKDTLKQRKQRQQPLPAVAVFPLGFSSQETHATAEERIALELGLAESAREDSLRKLELFSPPDVAATHSLSDSESSDEFDGAATGEADADPVAHAHKMIVCAPTPMS